MSLINNRLQTLEHYELPKHSSDLKSAMYILFRHFHKKIKILKEVKREIKYFKCATERNLFNVPFKMKVDIYIKLSPRLVNFYSYIKIDVNFKRYFRGNFLSSHNLIRVKISHFVILFRSALITHNNMMSVYVITMFNILFCFINCTGKEI